MKEQETNGGDILSRVAVRLAHTPSSSDHFILTKWRVLTLCQYMFGLPQNELELTCRSVLEVFAAKGAGVDFDEALERASEVARRIEGTDSILPSISADKRAAVMSQLDKLAADPDVINTALCGITEIAARIETLAKDLPLTGLKYRFSRIVQILVNDTGHHSDRILAAAAVLYVKEESDVIPDSLGVIGVMDDDYALRITLERVQRSPGESVFHWSEKVASLWEDLPFLRGVTLQKGQKPIVVGWLDRLNAYVAYTHAIAGKGVPLVLLEPSTQCSPLQVIISLLGLLTLEALTSAKARTPALRIGQTYEIDGQFHAKFEGISVSTMPGWLELRLRNGRVLRPPSLIDRMVPVEECRLSLGEDFPPTPKPTKGDPIQQFFHWNAAIGASAISTHLVVVASSKRARELLHGVESNGIKLLEHGLVRFLGEAEGELEAHGTLILVVSSLGAVRRLAEKGVSLQCVLVDGYEALIRARHDLPFLQARPNATPLIVWVPKGYYPLQAPTWLDVKCVEATRDDLIDTLELDGATDNQSAASLRQAVVGPAIVGQPIARTAEEQELVEALEAYISGIQSSEILPEHWRYHLRSTSLSILRMVAATPVRWVDLRALASAWLSQLNDKWGELRPRARMELAPLRELQDLVFRLFEHFPHPMNATASEMVRRLLLTPSAGPTYFVCHASDQASLSSTFFEEQRLDFMVATTLQDLPVCANCVVGGWQGNQFARRLLAHTPSSVLAFVDSADLRRWDVVKGATWQPFGESLVSSVSGESRKHMHLPSPVILDEPIDSASDGIEHVTWDEELVQSVVLTVSGRSEAKILGSQARVFVEESESIVERSAASLKSGERVILSSSISRWSPAEDFTEAVVNAVRTSNPRLVNGAKEWRRLLRNLVDAGHCSVIELQERLKVAGVEREMQTLEGWLNLSHASPISPQKGKTELDAIWRVVGGSEDIGLDEVVTACRELRRLRSRSGYALIKAWKGEPVQLSVDEAWLGSLVSQLRRKVEVYGLEAISRTQLPSSVQGWWLPIELINSMETTGRPPILA